MYPIYCVFGEVIETDYQPGTHPLKVCKWMIVSFLVVLRIYLHIYLSILYGRVEVISKTAVNQKAKKVWLENETETQGATIMCSMTTDYRVCI